MDLAWLNLKPLLLEVRSADESVSPAGTCLFPLGQHLDGKCNDRRCHFDGDYISSSFVSVSLNLHNISVLTPNTFSRVSYFTLHRQQ
ncbi:hypothetical protein ACHAWT_000285 [Skeletonema menzelii]